MYISVEDFYLDLNNSAEIHKDAVLHCAVDVGEDVDPKLAAFRYIYVGAEGHPNSIIFVFIEGKIEVIFRPAFHPHDFW